jgi:hypothetical protein
MDIITDCDKFYKRHYYLTFLINIFYKYITYILCILYLIWFPIYIIKTKNLHEFSNENITNIALIIYSFYKIKSILINKYNFIIEIIFELLFLTSAIYDIINNNNLYHIEYCIICSLAISIFIFIYGTFYCLVKSDFYYYDSELYMDYAIDIFSEVV